MLEIYVLQPIVQYDTLTLVDDGGTWVFDYAIAPTDAVALVDDLGLDQVLNMTDAVAVADQLDAAEGFDLQLADAATLVDFYADDFGIQVNPTDTLPLVDDVTFLAALGLDLVDALPLVDDLGHAQVLLLADVVGLLDAVIVDFPPQPIDQVDVVALNDVLDFAYGHDLQLSDALALADGLDAGQDVQLADTVALADQFVLALELEFADAVGLADALAADEALVLADVVALVDDPIFGYALFLAGDLVDVVALADSVTWKQITNWLIPLPEDGIAVSVSTDDTLTLTPTADDSLTLTPTGGATPIATGLPEDTLVGATLTEVEH